MNEQKLHLVHIYNAREAWQRAAGLILPAHTAYRLLKYVKRVLAEYEIVEQQRQKLVRDAAGVAEGEPAELKAGTPEHTRFVVEFGNVLDTECDLARFDMKLESLIDLIGKEQRNTLTARDLAVLEPFFKDDTQPAEQH